MLSNLTKILFIASAYSPILLIYWVVSVIKTNCYKTHWGLLLAFFILLLLCWGILYLIKSKLTRNLLEIKSLKSADNNFIPMITSYFLPFVELIKKDAILIHAWIILLILIIWISKSSFHYNPILKFVFGYRYYEVQTNKDVLYTLLTKKKLINKTQIKTYSQLTDYVILDANTQ